MTHHGKVLNLDGFFGNIYLEGNVFSYNIQAFSDCSVGEKYSSSEFPADT